MSTVHQFPNQITATQCRREYDSCIEILISKNIRLEQIGEEMEAINTKALSLNTEAHFINEELSLIQTRLENLARIMESFNNGLQTGRD